MYDVRVSRERVGVREWGQFHGHGQGFGCTRSRLVSRVGLNGGAARIDRKNSHQVHTFSQDYEKADDVMLYCLPVYVPFRTLKYEKPSV